MSGLKAANWDLAGEGDERGRSFLEPKKEPKKAAFVAVNAAGFAANRL